MLCSTSLEGMAKIVAFLTDDLEKQRNLMYYAIMWKSKFGFYATPKPEGIEVVFPLCEN